MRSLFSRSRSKFVMRVLFVNVLAVSMLAGCAQTKSDNPYAADYAEAIANTESEYQKGILEDGVITAEEMRDAQQQTITCLKTAGISAKYSDDSGSGIFSLEYESSSEADSVNDQEIVMGCTKQWIDDIEPLYYSQVTNPQNEDFDSLIAACLVRKEIAPAGFSGKDYKKLMEDNSKSVTVSEEELADGTYMEELSEMTGQESIQIPGGKTLDEPDAVLCMMNPQK